MIGRSWQTTDFSSLRRNGDKFICLRCGVSAGGPARPGPRRSMQLPLICSTYSTNRSLPVSLPAASHPASALFRSPVLPAPRIRYSVHTTRIGVGRVEIQPAFGDAHAVAIAGPSVARKRQQSAREPDSSPRTGFSAMYRAQARQVRFRLNRTGLLTPSLRIPERPSRRLRYPTDLAASAFISRPIAAISSPSLNRSPVSRQ